MKIKYLKLNIRRARQMKINKTFVLLFVLFIITNCVIFKIYFNVIEPVITDYSKAKSYTVGQEITDHVILNNLKEIYSNDVILRSENKNGQIDEFRANADIITEIASKIDNEMLDEVNKYEKSNIKIPLFMLFNVKQLGNIGINIKIKILPRITSNTNYNIIIENIGINKIRYQVVLDINTSVRIIAPVYTDIVTYNKKIILVDCILNGEVPNSYSN